jgi:hypothetical protein
VNEDRITYHQLGQLDVRWDSGSTLSVLLNDGDRVRLITPAPSRTRGNREGAGPVSASSPQPAAPEAVLRQAGNLGRRHGRAAVYWQIGDTSTGREFCQELLRGIASADPAITGLYEVPDLTARWDYERGNLAADLQLAGGDPALAQAAQVYLAARPARSSGWRPPGWPAGAWHPRPGTRTKTAPSPRTPRAASLPRTGGRTSPTRPPA